MVELGAPALEIHTKELGWGYYLINARAEGMGEMQAKMALAPDDTRLQNELDAIYHHRAREDTMRAVGEHLYHSLLGALEGLWQEYHERTRSQGHVPTLRLTIESSGLMALPWEMMFDEQGEPVVGYAALVRYLPTPARLPPIAASFPLRLLLAVASPSGFRRIDTAGEIRLILDGLDAVVSAGQLRTEEIPHTTFDALRRSLAGSPHLLHVVLHSVSGGPVTKMARMSKSAEMSSGLAFEDGYGDIETIDPDQFASLFRSRPELGVVVLDTCRVPALPAMLLERGQSVRAVLSHQFEVRDINRDYTPFWHEFYAQVANGSPVDNALFRARQELLVRPGLRALDWASPVLTMSGSGQVFDLLDLRQASPTTEAVSHRAFESTELVMRPFTAQTGLKSIDEAGQELEILERRQVTLDKMIVDFYGGQEHAPGDLKARWNNLRQQIDDLRRHLRSRRE